MWQEQLLKADKELTEHAKKYGEARLQVQYYADRDNVVRKKLIISPEVVRTYYDKAEEIED